MVGNRERVGRKMPGLLNTKTFNLGGQNFTKGSVSGQREVHYRSNNARGANRGDHRDMTKPKKFLNDAQPDAKSRSNGRAT